ncbi:MAG: Crp/Fnr family transcriptional regulator [Sulfurospirillaceae bacterium]|jgi:CRP/FNR family transcriptional regulator|nr:Crp/Fnr family transcriptional regulator [Sulfurospirillaceae bacterium]MCK9545753.1 Crp/Fnr family transcriptional regulator [Sulfurospirillaceae bacterium]MDY0238111.1 Crp/Fnr family transcriptional regulator [Campylobacterales bacterium]
MHILNEVSLFSKLDKEELKLLKNISTSKKYSKGEILFYEGDRSKNLHLLVEGILKLYKTNFKGQQIFLHQFYPQSFVAELTNFEDIPFPASAEFITDGVVLKIDFEKFKTLIHGNPNLSLKIIRSLSEKLKIMSEVIHNEVILNSEAKVAKMIVELPELFGDIKNTKIAQLLNITPETLSRTLSKFKQLKIVKIDESQKITYSNLKKLSKFYE